MSQITVILLLTFIWCGFSAHFNTVNIISGLLISTIIFWLTAPKDYRHIRLHPIRLILLLIHTAWLLVISSFEVAFEIITPKQISNPAILEIPLACEHRYQILLLTHLVSLTPGTLCLDVCEIKNTITIHAMFAKDKSKIIATIKNKLEKLVLQAIEVK